MSKRVQFEKHGGRDVLQVADGPDPVPETGEVLVAVRAAGINPGEAAIREGVFAQRWPSTFPSGQGSDLAGVVQAVGAGVTRWAPGDEVIGWTDKRASQAELVVVEAEHLVPRPASVPWEVAGGLFVAGVTAMAAVRAVAPQPGETVVVSGAAGGVGAIAAQVARHAGATVIGLAGAANHDWLREHGIVPVAYGARPAAGGAAFDAATVAGRVRAAAPDGVDAFVDTYGQGYVALAVDELGVAPDRVDTIIDWDGAEQYGVKTDASLAGSSPEVLGELVGLVAGGAVEVPVTAYPLADVRAAYEALERRHTRGKIVLIP